MSGTNYNIEAIVNQYVHVLENQGVHVRKAILYGSYAKGNAREESDIDLVVISDDFERMQDFSRLEFLSKATLNIPGPLEVLGYTPDEVKGKEGKSILWDEICKTGRVVYESH